MAALILLQDAYRRNLRRERVFRDRSNDLETLDNNQLISRYRFPRAVILEIIGMVSNDVRRPTCRSNALKPCLQVLVTLRFLAKGDFQSETGDIHGVTKSSVSRSISAVCNSICINMDNILFPNDTEELRRIKEEFYDMAQVPNVVGAIDGTLIPIQGMSSDDEHVYVCRKGFHSLNIKAVVDAKMRFLNINCRFPGSTHDAFILQSSSVPEAVMNLPEGGMLLGDSGYPLKTWLMTPLLHPATPQEVRYNKAHCKTRTVVERAFGVLKSRFRCSHKTEGSLPYKPLKCSRIIETCFRLHNKAIEARVPLIQGGEVRHVYQNNVHNHQPNRDAQALRQRIISRF